MASEAQIAANRLNAQKSTGPRTAEGKARLARSALQHGLTAATLVLFDESEEDFDEFHSGVSLDLEPVGSIERALVERIAILSWRLRRASRTEAALINAEARKFNDYLEREEWPHKPRADIGIAFDRCTDEITALSRYEAAIERQLNRTIATLQRCQTRRLERMELEAEENDPPLPEPGSAYTSDSV
jgi:hypothetical protein